jgi:hypothetical protein
MRRRRGAKCTKQQLRSATGQCLARLAKKFVVLVQGVFESSLMHGRKDQKNANESGNTASGGLDEQALTRDLKRVVEESDLSIPKIASKMGVSAQPPVCGLQELPSRLERKYLRLKIFLKGATEIFRPSGAASHTLEVRYLPYLMRNWFVG